MKRPELKDELNCPNCGAPLGLSDKCEYCGTHFVDCTMDTEKPFYIKIRRGGALFVDKVYLSSMEVEMRDGGCSIEMRDGFFRVPRIEKTYHIELESMGVNI